MKPSATSQHRLVGDFETYYDADYSLSKLTTPQYVLDDRFELILAAWKFGAGRIVYTHGLDATMTYLANLPWDEGIEFVAHNAFFDASILEWRLGFKAQRYFCTMMGARPFIAPYAGGRMSLAKVSEYLQLPAKGTEVVRAIGKRFTDFTGDELMAYTAYCCHDTDLCNRIEQWLRPRFPDEELNLIDRTIKKFLRPQFKLHVETLETRATEIVLHKQALLEQCGMSDRKNLMSNNLFAQTLEAMGVEVPMKISPTTGKETFAFAKKDPGFLALLEHDNPDVQLLVAARMGHKSTIEETRIQRLLDVAMTTEDRALPVPLLYYGAHTGRHSGFDKINLQNLTRGSALRRAIRALKDGYCILAGDLSQIEARIVAWLAGADDLVQAFAEGRDIYSEFATKIFGRTITKADVTERFIGKVCILGLGYGMGAPKLRETLAIGMGGVSAIITLQEARRIVNLYRSTYPQIPLLWNRAETLLPIIAQAPGSDAMMALGPVTAIPGQIILPNRMPISYPELSYDGDQWTARLNGKVRNLWGGAVTENIVQALARIVISTGEETLASYGIEAGLQVHDELVYAVPARLADKYKRAVELALTRPVAWAPDLPVACEVGIGPNYAEAK